MSLPGQTDADNILFLKYEEMKQDQLGVVKKIADFINHPLPEETLQRVVNLSSFDHMKTFLTNATSKRLEGSTDFFRKGVVGDWKNLMTKEQSERLDAVYKKRMCGTGLDFRFE